MITTAPTKKENYAYSVALIRTLETMLLNDNEVDRMVLASNANDAFKILNEFDYSDNTEGITDPAKFQKVINEGIVEIKQTLDKICPDKNVLNILWFSYDFHNIKTMLKALLGGKSYEDIEDLISPLGAIAPEALRKFIFDEESAAFGLDEKMEEMIKEKIKKCKKLFEEEGKKPQVIDLYLDQKLIKAIYMTAIHSKNGFLIKYVKTLIDLTNIRLFFRMRSQNKNKHLFKIALLWRGSIPYKKFLSAYNGTLAEFTDEMSATPYSDLIKEGYAHFEKEKNFIELEKGIENYLTNYIKKAKQIPFGPEPLIAYYLAKKNNALILRMILI
ncbi:hypothetical protein GF354_00275, partial [Candidatus Peregrinibacteria bacterium]|nr:hypothetical protein [Candidatus Peregrinibacteria bacterium]